MAKRYVPERGDVVWLRFDPQAGHEQAGKRPALVLSPSATTAALGLHFFVRSPLSRRAIRLRWHFPAA